ncbi:hypothetical protein [Flavisolibacter tropicus]|uniref:MalT-like TPR region domain-containing protein n=1 Tax=Flavisolibacter tropicus TaxID=1492898 RepID=A0A172TS38_9BACT|nr:hypothetical protein [Flavisolibacter tropicus]ANE49694.1 hypothetical protein SY85_03460 [Flavisolibacter tropicus]
MSNRSTDILFQLIRSLEKAEKRHFKLYINRNSSNENLKIVQLFDALDKAKEYDEKLILRKVTDIQKAQLSNLKAHLYKQILASLRLLKSADSLDLQLNEQFDYAHILYKKGLFLQSLKILEKVKALANANQKYSFLPQIINLEKRIEALHITRSMEDRAESLSMEAIEVSKHIDMVARLSNLSLLLYSWYIKNGHARNEQDEDKLKEFLKTQLPDDAWEQTGFYERMYLYQSYAWYAFIRRDFLMYYRYSQKWINLFHENPLMKRVETGHYIKGLHNLLNAHFDIRNYKKFQETLLELEAFSKTDRVQENENFRIHSFIYISQAKMNQHFMTGSFEQSMSLVKEIEDRLKDYEMFIDNHRVLVLNYKIATLYFGNNDFEKSIDYLHKIIHQSTDLRYDLQCYARLLHLLAHFELGNHDLIEHLAKSVYRYMAKMKNTTALEREMFKFLRQAMNLSRYQLKEEMVSFLERIKVLEKNRFENRSFAYLDVVSWIESKIQNRKMSEIVQEKYKKGLQKKQLTPISGL